MIYLSLVISQVLKKILISNIVTKRFSVEKKERKSKVKELKEKWKMKKKKEEKEEEK